MFQSYHILGQNVAVPLFYDGDGYNSPLYVHLKDLVCPLEDCKKKGRSKKHALIDKAKPLCLHMIVGLVSDVTAEKEKTKQVVHEIDFKGTVKKDIQRVKEEFPKSYRLLEEGKFLMESNNFVTKLFSSELELEEKIPKICNSCKVVLEVWKRKTPRSYLISLGGIKKVSIPVKVCPLCRCAFYPDLYANGIIFLHNKDMVSVDLLMDLLNVLKAGGGMIETIQLRIRLLGNAAGITIEEISTDLTASSIKLEKATIAFGAIMITEKDLDEVTCYFCGACPKIVSTGMYKFHTSGVELWDDLAI